MPHRIHIHLTHPSNLIQQFPVAAITNQHRPGGLQQQNFILSQIWRQELASRYQKGYLPLRSSREESLPASSSCLVLGNFPWLVASLTQSASIFTSHSSLCLYISSPLLFHNDACDSPQPDRISHTAPSLNLQPHILYPWKFQTLWLVRHLWHFPQNHLIVLILYTLTLTIIRL